MFQIAACPRTVSVSGEYLFGTCRGFSMVADADYSLMRLLA